MSAKDSVVQEEANKADPQEREAQPVQPEIEAKSSVIIMKEFFAVKGSNVALSIVHTSTAKCLAYLGYILCEAIITKQTSYLTFLRGPLLFMPWFLISAYGMNSEWLSTFLPRPEQTMLNVKVCAFGVVMMHVMATMWYALPGYLGQMTVITLILPLCHFPAGVYCRRIQGTRLKTLAYLYNVEWLWLGAAPAGVAFTVAFPYIVEAMGAAAAGLVQAFYFTASLSISHFLLKKMYEKAPVDVGSKGMVVHQYAMTAIGESFRFASLLNSTIQDPSMMSWLTAMPLCLCFNAFQRTHWLKALQFAKTKQCPTQYHYCSQEVKYYSSYPRFIAPATLLLIRLICGSGGTPFYFNRSFVYCCIAVITCTVLEDGIVYLAEKMKAIPNFILPADSQFDERFGAGLMANEQGDIIRGYKWIELPLVHNTFRIMLETHTAGCMTLIGVFLGQGMRYTLGLQDEPGDGVTDGIFLWYPVD